MRAILVDDEKLALIQLKLMLERDVGGIQVVGTYSNPMLVMDGVRELKPDAVFLDIHMPGISGLKLGEQLQQHDPNMKIVFISGDEQYALKAFDLAALDYIVKPIEAVRLMKTVERLRGRVKRKDSRGLEDSPMIRCLNQIRFQLPGQEPQTVKWRTSKAQELFAYLLHHRERTVDRETLIELLWPTFDAEKAARQLYTTIYHIRRTLQSYGMTGVSIASGDLEAGYKLALDEVRIDIEEWEQQLRRLNQPTLPRLADHERVLELYEGEYFGYYEYLWAEHERERIRRMWTHHATNLSRFYTEQGMLQKAIRVNQRMQQRLPYEEDSYFKLMKLYDELNDHAGVEEQYWLLRNRWEQELELDINPSITEWYNKRKYGEIR